MFYRMLECWLLLLRVEILMRTLEFNDLYQLVREAPIHSCEHRTQTPSEQLCTAMDFACVLYFKPVLCLQRSSATALLLRRHGWKAERVIGVQLLPFKSHAWVEIDRLVVNDKPYMNEIYQVLERC